MYSSFLRRVPCGFAQQPAGAALAYGCQSATAKHANRRGWIDSIRGFTLMQMIAYHALWDLVHLYGVKISWFTGAGGFLWQQSICWTFILLSGFCWSYGSRPLRRGLTVFTAGAIVSLTTVVAAPDQVILFGVLTLISSCMLIMIPLNRLMRKLPPVIGLLLSGALFLFTRTVPSGHMVFGLITLPPELYCGLLSAYLGFPPASFYSTDYFPMLPWMFLFFMGYFFSRCMPTPSLSSGAFSGTATLRFLGRNSLPVYLAHQPVLYAAFALICD